MQVGVNAGHSTRSVLVDPPDDRVAPVHQRDFFSLLDLERVSLIDPDPIQAQLRFLTGGRVLLVTKDSQDLTRHVIMCKSNSQDRGEPSDWWISFEA